MESPGATLVRAFAGGALAVGMASAGLTAPAAAQALPQKPGASWIEAGALAHHVSNDFGNWQGAYARAVLAGARNVWYLEAKAQEAFRDDGVYGSITNVHTWTSFFYTQVGIGGGTGEFVLPALREDLALNFKLGRARSLVLTVGETYINSQLVYEDKAFFASLSWYASGTVLVEAGGRINWSDPGNVRSQRASGALTIGRVGKSQLTLRGNAGSEGYQLTGVAQTLRRFNSWEAGASWRAWLSRSWGVVIGDELYHNPFYTRAGATVGLFRAW
ncbi:MAG TPA: YaiO family outer membrane beta-barrel protein [Gemmatimonadales bacterium]|jgi:YaiO family outer membrane protein|nr:YaiO family outer membrane beta-barrel protein [Gemmatimonadales bacterium]